MDDLFNRAWEQLLGRAAGPLHFRLVLQPLMAACVAIRAGLQDAKTSRPAYLWAVWSRPAERRALIHHGCRDISRVFAFSLLLDAVYQVLVLQWFYPLQALIVAFAFAIVPYMLIRGPTRRIAARWRSRETLN